MNNRLKSALYLLVSVSSLWCSHPCKADVVFPARLEVTETTPGTFEVLFVLPIMQGKVLKAHPVLPTSCSPLTEPADSGDSNVKTSRWKISCLPDSLYGQKFGIDGLLGSQVDILFSLKMLNGRSYQRMLSPVNAFFIVPSPPRTLNLTKHALLNGLRTILSHGALYLLILMVAITKSGTKRTSANSADSLVTVAVIGYAIGHQLTAVQWLLIPDQLPAIITLLVTFILSLQYLYKVNSVALVNWLSLALLAILYGSFDYNPDSLEGFTATEQITASMTSYLGVAIGILIIYWLSINLSFIINLLVKKWNIQETTRCLAYFGGVISFGLLLYQLSPYLFGAGPRITLPLLPVIFTIVVSCWTSGTFPNHIIQATCILLLLLLIGLAISLTGIRLDWAGSWISMVILATAIYVGFKTTPAKWFNLLLIGSGAIMSGFYLGNQAMENLSYANAQALGFVLILGLIFLPGYQLSSQTAPALNHSKPFRLAVTGLLVIFVAISWHSEGSRIPLNQMISDHATGILHIPVASLLLLLVAVIFWPRYRSIHKSMGLKPRAPVTSMVLVGVAIFLFPWLTLKASNPFSGNEAPDLDRAEVIIQQVLSNTYHAFNLQDEDQLYDQLSKSVDQDLIEDIYLDSRRKLRAGVRQGAEVLVKEVELLELSQAPGEMPDDLLQFETKWVVTARVRHLQHIHHRKNQYTGSIVLRTGDTGWKISGITLTSEDRTVIPNASG